MGVQSALPTQVTTKGNKNKSIYKPLPSPICALDPGYIRGLNWRSSTDYKISFAGANCPSSGHSLLLHIIHYFIYHLV